MAYEIEAPDNGFLLAYMEEFFDSQAGPFYNLLSMGFSAEAFGVPMVASGVVLYLASEGEDTSEFTDIVTENMANAEIPDYDGIIGLANCIALVTAFPQFVSGDAQVFSSISLEHSFLKLRDFSENNGLPVGKVNIATAFTFTGVQF
ncbi:uncharacterized protein LOC118424881 [Branchiostoma floridae]|uniref:Uncharacterized protein LOC118424881 n=1 Tax=Branchiostoma floridae TaxID=7739 RepID=A0A9J7N4W3_BRAFL|nr:uncharacterized protein LOC118424881 [Branchiostoma floridae]